VLRDREEREPAVTAVTAPALCLVREAVGGSLRVLRNHLERRRTYWGGGGGLGGDPSWSSRRVVNLQVVFAGLVLASALVSLPPIMAATSFADDSIGI
jgi:hypothetical protein